MSEPKFQLGDRVQKISGSEWQGLIVGTYSTALTPEGYCVESEFHPGSVQIYPAAALEKSEGDGIMGRFRWMRCRACWIGLAYFIGRTIRLAWDKKAA